ncbi:beta-galactosidase [Saccharothrix sp. 6-C]|uniref:Beta-galactosidase n=1 Tax=Saccharothrix texasensis TaxID=103734 RepID=A0A3N1H848_9PSEU|nr:MULTISPECIES: beta-galactosidase [Saccharothrix]QQQ77045.1 beta-galactosidase [Saccharothrix sp. 6-C]ROP38611.1 beta-galactosidase [Saccharothrix texasensis]
MTMWPTRVPGLAWGADYNPEQWPEDVWDDDVELMRRAGVNLVSVAIFSWALLEVEEGRYEFGWLDRVLDRLHAGGIRVDLATATAAPPPWLTTAHPEMLPETADGVRLVHGSRQSYCPSSPVYRSKAVALARALAERYRDHPALAAWHVNNEYGCHVSRCYCDRCAVAFRAWLRARHGTLDVLNEAWGTAFWSQRYTSWEQVLPPRATPTSHNPGQLLDFDRFSSDALLELYKAERDVLREVTPDVPVTTNFMAAAFAGLDYWTWAAEVDFVSNDHYTRAEDAERHVDLAYSADLVRGLAGGRPWLLMEHSTSAVNWQPRNIAKLPGELRRNSYAHMARGADGTLFFQWRQSRAGAERYHSAMVPHAGPDTKVYREVEQVGAEYRRLAELVGSTVDAPVAVVFDWESWWALGRSGHPTSDFAYPEHVFGYYRALWRAGVTVDFVPPGADLSPYRLVVVPALYGVDDASPYEEHVAAGGHVLVTYLSGVTDTRGHVHLGGYPGAFRELLGVRTEEFHPLRAGEAVALDDGSSVAVWTEHLHVDGAEVVASYADGPLPGVPAVTRNERGAGVAWYVACGLAGDGLERLVRTALDRAGVPVGPGGDVEVVRRRGEVAGSAVSWLVAVNHGTSDAELPAVGVELLSGARASGGVVVPAGGVVVIREEEV